MAIIINILVLDRKLLWLNLGRLLKCMLIPLPTAILADALQSGDPADLCVAGVLYASMAAMQTRGSRSSPIFATIPTWSSRVLMPRCFTRSASGHGSEGGVDARQRRRRCT